MAVWCGLDAHTAAHATMRASRGSASDLMDLTSGHAAKPPQVCGEPLAANKGWFTAAECSNVVTMMQLSALLPFLYVCRSLLFQGDQAYSSHF